MKIVRTVTIVHVTDFEVTPDTYEGVMDPAGVAAKEKEYIEEAPSYFFEGLMINESKGDSLTVVVEASEE